MEKKRLDVHTTDSKKKGLSGAIEKLIRKSKNLGVIIALIPVMICYIACISISVIPCISLLIKVWKLSIDSEPMMMVFNLSLALGFCFILFVLGIIFTVPFFNWLLLLPFGKLKPFRAIGHSFETIPWYYHNAMVQLARYTVLDFLAPTPFLVLFYKMMGMKIGKGVVINSTNISDPALITIEDHVVIGGSATIFAHYGMHGFLIVSKTVIKKGATIGLKASIMGDVIVGENQTVAPGETLLPKTRLPDIPRK